MSIKNNVVPFHVRTAPPSGVHKELPKPLWHGARTRFGTYCRSYDIFCRCDQQAANACWEKTKGYRL